MRYPRYRFKGSIKPKISNREIKRMASLEAWAASMHLTTAKEQIAEIDANTPGKTEKEGEKLDEAKEAASESLSHITSFSRSLDKQ